MIQKHEKIEFELFIFLLVSWQSFTFRCSIFIVDCVQSALVICGVKMSFGSKSDETFLVCGVEVLKLNVNIEG